MSRFAEFSLIKESVKNDLSLALGVMQMAELTGCSWREIVSWMGFNPVAAQTAAGGRERVKRMVYKPEMVWGKVANTSLPMDGCTLCFTSWEHDNHGSWHLHSWKPEDDEAVMQTMFYTEMAAGICEVGTLEEFARIWDAGEWEPDGVFCLPKDKVDVVEKVKGGQG